MNDPRYNDLFKWGIENSDASRNDLNAPIANTKFNPNVLQELLGGKAPLTDSQVMENSVEVIEAPNSTRQEKIEAFEALEALLPAIDNANNMEHLGLWHTLLQHLNNEEAELRKLAAWCMGTAVENNIKAQERLLIHGAIPTLVTLAITDEDMEVRKKAVLALSAASRNFQPALDAVVDYVPPHFKPQGKLDAGDMSSVDSLINPLREDARRSR